MNSEETRSAPQWQFSDYVVYVDESGDHSLTRIDHEFPVFVLALCVFDKRHYADETQVTQAKVQPRMFIRPTKRKAPMNPSRL